MHYYSHHIGDYASHTAHLTPMEDICYRRMLDLYFMREAPLPKDFQQVARLIRMADSADLVQNVLDEFFQLLEDGYHSARADADIASYQRMAEGGRKGAAMRWSKPGNTRPIATASPSHDDLNANQNQEPVTNTRSHKPVGTSSLRSEVVAPAGDKPLTAATLVALGVAERNASAWLQVRKTQRAPLTLVAWDAVVREAQAAGISLDDAVRISAENSWRGFKAEWYANLQRRTGGTAGSRVNRQQALEERNRQVAQTWAIRGRQQEGATMQDSEWTTSPSC